MIGASSAASSVTDSAGVLAWKMSMRSGRVLLEKEQTPLKIIALSLVNHRKSSSDAIAYVHSKTVSEYVFVSSL